MEIALIAAVAENGVIGKNGKMPWHYPEDLQHFRELTLGSPVIMGRVTFESIVEKLGGPLTDRVTIVLTRNPDDVQTDFEDDDSTPMDDITTVHTASSVDEALAIAHTEYADEVYVAGGATVYEQYLHVADRIEMTEIHDTYDGDAEFPEWDRRNWVEVNRDDRDELSFVTYERIKP